MPTGVGSNHFDLGSADGTWPGALASDVREAAVSTARKNGETALLVGPLRLRNWRAIVVSPTGSQAAELKR